MMENNDIAIISLSGRFPNCDNVNLFWNMLLRNETSIKEIDKNSLIAKGCQNYLNFSSYVNKCSVINHPELFDADFFKMNKTEAMLCDPQQRLFLQCCFEALNLAGHPNPEKQGIRTGVFAGCSINTYFIFNLLPSEEIMRREQTQLIMSAAHDFLASRVAYVLNLKGPAITVQTACSTSLVAVHQACQSLLSGEIDLALAGGATVSAFREMGYFYTPEGIRSSDGFCRPFDKDGDGTIFGDGVGVVVLCRLEDALKNNNYIYAILKASAVNNDGNNKAGFTAPSVSGQAAVIEEAMGLAGIEAEQMNFVEAHGTATKLGDPIEFKALVSAYSTSKKQYCALGSVKSNVGHLDSASGVVGLIKAALALRHRVLPATLNYCSANPEIDIENSPFFICHQNLLLNQFGDLFAGVSSFGIGGTNAHVILSTVPEKLKFSKKSYKKINHEFVPNIYLWSDRSEEALEKLIIDNIKFISESNDFNANDYSYSLKQKYQHEYRACFVTKKESYLPEIQQIFKHRTLNNPKTIFFIPSVDGNYINISQKLYLSNAIFREYFNHFSLKFYHYDNTYDLRNIFSSHSKIKEDSGAIYVHQPFYQEAVFFILISGMVKFFENYGIEVDLLINDIFGELIAAYVAQAISEDDMIKIIIERTKLVDKTSQKYQWIEILNHIDFQPLQTSVLSNVSGDVMFNGDVYTFKHWLAYLKQEVSIFDGISKLLSYYKNNSIEPIFVKLGQMDALGREIEQIDGKFKVISMLDEDNEFNLYYLIDNVMAKLWVLGLNPDLSKLIPESNIIPVPIAYLKLKSYWIDPHYSNQSQFVVDKLHLGKIQPSSSEENGQQKISLIQDEQLLTKILLDIFRKTLMSEEFNIQNNFFEFGGDSISALEICRQLSQYELKITPKIIFELQNIDKIISYLKENYLNSCQDDTSDLKDSDIQPNDQDNQEEIKLILEQIEID